MRTITKDITLTLDGKPTVFRLTKLDAFSGASLLRLLLRLQETSPRPTTMDLLASLSETELRQTMTACLNHTEVLLPAGPHPVMTGPEWGYPELKHETLACVKLTVEGISWSLSDFFSDGASKAPPASPATSP